MIQSLRGVKIINIGLYFKELKIVTISVGKAFPFIFLLLIFSFCYFIFMANFPVKFISGMEFHCTNYNS